MFCIKCGSKLKENAKFCENCGAKISGEKVENNFPDNIKKTLSKVDKKIEEKLPDNLKKKKKVIYIGTCAIIMLFILFFLTRGYSQNIQIVRSWQNSILADNDVTFGEAMDYALEHEKWIDTVYDGEPAVQLTGTYRKNGVDMKAIFYVNKEDHVTMFAYYEEDGNKRSSSDVAFRVSEYADQVK